MCKARGAPPKISHLISLMSLFKQLFVLQRGQLYILFSFFVTTLFLSQSFGPLLGLRNPLTTAGLIFTSNSDNSEMLCMVCNMTRMTCYNRDSFQNLHIHTQKKKLNLGAISKKCGQGKFIFWTGSYLQINIIKEFKQTAMC